MRRPHQSLHSMENACVVAIDSIERGEEWMNAFSAVCDPYSVRHLITQVHDARRRVPCSEEDMRNMIELVKALTSYIKETGNGTDPMQDYLLIRAKQTMAKLEK
jgi:hypothetical protein